MSHSVLSKMSNAYFHRLDDECKRLYLDKLKYNRIQLPDPLDTKLRLHSYKPLSQDNVPDLAFGDIYMFLVETAQVYSRKEFKNYKTLNFYKTALSGKVQDILVYKCDNAEMCVLTCDVQGDEGIIKLYRAWVVVAYNGAVQNGHCTCMNEFVEGCQHIAALLLSLEVYIKKDTLLRNSSLETSTEKKPWLSFAGLVDDKSDEKKNSSSNTILSTDYKERLKAIKRIVPNAPIFTLLCDSDISSSDEDEIEERPSTHTILKTL